MNWKHANDEQPEDGVEVLAWLNDDRVIVTCFENGGWLDGSVWFWVDFFPPAQIKIMENFQSQQEVHNLHWEFRGRCESVFPTPDRVRAAKYALTELAEVVEYDLRSKPGDVRNKERSVDLNGELADLWLMLDTAMGAETDFTHPSVNEDVPGISSLDHVSLAAVKAIELLLRFPEVTEQSVIWATRGAQAIICAVPGFDLVDSVSSTLERWEKRVEVDQRLSINE